MIRSVTRLEALSRHPRMLLALPAAALAVTLAACGPSAHPAVPKPVGVAHSHAHSAPAHAAVTTPPASPATAPAPPANLIPQGNGGDQDADNNGGPSDGDGNI
jgi:hypothetical protein